MPIGKRSIGQVLKLLRLAQEYQSIGKCDSWHVARGVSMALLWMIGKEQTQNLIDQLNLRKPN